MNEKYLELLISIFKYLSVGHFLICIIMFLFSKRFINKDPYSGKGKRILLLTAHPDDECMFFSPLVIHHSRENEVHHELHVICATSGNFDNQGSVRKKELLKSCKILGVQEKNVKVLDDSSFPDGFSVTWDYNRLADELSQRIKKIRPDYIFTFDSGGVSGHPNHCSVSFVIRQIASSIRNSIEHVRFFELETVGLLRKYCSFLDLPLSALGCRLIFVSSPFDVLTAQKAMGAHWSQLVWFRWLYIIFSRYMVINTFKEYCT